MAYTQAELAHYGIKGMKWGIRRDKATGSVTVGNKTFTKQQVKKAAIIFGSAVGVAAITVGSIYAAKRFGGVGGGAKLSDIPAAAPATKKFAESMAKEPVGIIHGARGKHKGWTFPGQGGLENPLSEYDKAFQNIDGQGAGAGVFRRYGDNMEKVAASFKDPLGRKDRAGRDILHEVILPKDLAKNVTNADEARDVAWPLIKDKYESFYEQMPSW